MDLTAVLALLAVGLSLAALIVALGATVRVDRFVRAGIPPRMGLHVGMEVDNDLLSSVLPEATRAAWLAGPSIILFASSSCEPCLELVRKVRERGHMVHQPRVLLVELASTGADNGSGNSIEFDAIVVQDTDGRLQRAFQVAGTPHTFLIEGGRVKRQTVGLDGLSLFEALDVTTRVLAAAEA